VWAKVDALLPQHPKCQEAGFWGTTVYFHLLLLNKAHGCGGLIPVAFVTPKYLAKYTGLIESDPEGAQEKIRLGLNQAKGARLISLTPQGVQVVGWDTSWDRQATPGAERTRKWREKQGRDESVTPESHGVTPESHGDTESHKVTCDDRSDQSRSDQSRSEGRESGIKIPDATPEAKKQKRAPKEIPEQTHLMAQLLADYVVENNPDHTLAQLPPAERTKRLAKWADVFRLMNERDRHTWAQIQGMIDWSQQDEFWATNAQSAEGMRRNWDTIAGQRNGQGRPRTRTRPKDVTVGSVAPKPHDSYADGEVEL